MAVEDSDDELMNISVLTIGEVCKGITVHTEGAPPRLAASVA